MPHRITRTGKHCMAIMRAPFVVVVIALFAAGCATVPGQNYPKEASTAFAHPETTKLGRQWQARAPEHPEVSGFRLLVEGIDGFLIRAEMANAAEQTLDLQYYIIQNDNTGKLLMDAVLRAADRGVRVRMLIDDTTIRRGTRKSRRCRRTRISRSASSIHFFARVFHLLRYPEFLFAGTRSTIACTTSCTLRTTRSRCSADAMSATNTSSGQRERVRRRRRRDRWTAGEAGVEEFRRLLEQCARDSRRRLVFTKADPRQLDRYRAELAEHRGKMQGSNYVKRLATNEPLEGIAATGAQLIWAKASCSTTVPKSSRSRPAKKSGPLLRRS